ncbi:MAG: hypothetical protein ACTHK8_19080 [Ginsengibacter sp.]
MARTIDEIYNEMFAEAQRRATDAGRQDLLDMLANTSKVSWWSILFNTMSFLVWSLEKVCDGWQALINSIIGTKTPHTLRWYQTKVLAFQYGYDLVAETDTYDNSALTDDQITESLVVKYCAVNEATVDDRRVLLIKVAGADANGILQPLTDLQEAALNAYIAKIKDAGVYVIIYNRVADSLKTEVDVYYDPLILDENGNRLDGVAGVPVQDAANAFLLTLPFNGEFSNAAFIDALQNAYGVDNRNVFLKSIQRKIGDGAYQAVVNTFIPDAGYTQFDVVDGLKINYVAHV